MSLRKMLREVNSEDWAEVCRAASKLLDSPRQDWEVLLAGVDERLRDIVRGVVDGYSEKDDLFGVDSPVAEIRREVELETGALVGTYRITKLLGVGGMGRVYQAVREYEGFSRVVALKVARRGGRLMEEGFRRERILLSTLEHPGIARLLDGGSLKDGTPYLVMEYVDGEPLLGYCMREGLGWVERLRVFRPVFEAVEYAHRKGLVHRDLKPSNIIVNHHGKAKLLDFGLAARRTPGGGPVVGYTPKYAGPELKRFETGDERSDVYSLGVILEELLGESVPADVAGILVKARQEVSAVRWDTVQEMRVALERVSRG